MKFIIKKINYSNDYPLVTVVGKTDERTSAILIYNQKIQNNIDINTIYIVSCEYCATKNIEEIIIHGSDYVMVNQLNEIVREGSSINLDSDNEKLNIFKTSVLNYKRISEILKNVSFRGYISGIIDNEKIEKAIKEIEAGKSNSRSVSSLSFLYK